MGSRYFRKAAIATIGLATLASAGLDFPKLDTNFASPTFRIPASPVRMDVLFVGGTDSVTVVGGPNDGKRDLAKQQHDFIGYLPINGRSDSGFMVVNHETRDRNPIQGGGGGVTVFTVWNNPLQGKWQVVDHPKGRFRTLDFSSVGYTANNCGGVPTPWGTFLTAEEFPPSSNAEVGAYLDTNRHFVVKQHNGAAADDTLNTWQALGWMVELDPSVPKVVRKNFNMGRFSHEGGYCLDDRKTCYLTDDFTPGVFFKFVADAAGSYEKGQLHAYRQSGNGQGGDWIALPMDLRSLMNARAIALDSGATAFNRLEWAEMVDGKLYFTETGADLYDMGADPANPSGKLGLKGKLAKHLQARDAADGTVDSSLVDYYGRILVYDPSSHKVDVFLEGGTAANDPAKNLASPDGLASVKIDGKSYLFINEDLTGITQNRMPAGSVKGREICETYVLDMSIAHPKVDDLVRFNTSSLGAELTGGRFTPNGKTYFINNQHPNATLNTFPFNNSVTIAVSGYAETATYLDKPVFSKSRKFQLAANPLSRIVHMNKTADVAIYDSTGKRVMVRRRTNQLDVSRLESGSYVVQTSKGEAARMVLE